MDHNQLHKWKKEKDLIGKDYGLRGGRQGSLKTVQIQDEESPELLKANKIPEERLKASYTPNKAIQEKLAEKKPEAKGWDKVKELTKELSEDMKTEVLAAYDKFVDEPTTRIEEQITSIEETQPEPFISYKEQLENLQKEKALLEDKHAREMKEMEKSLYEALKHSKYRELMQKVSNAVTAERHRQNSLYGHQRHDSGKWLAILAEEFGEVAQAMQRGEGWGKESDADDLFKELTHVSAVANAWAEQVLEEAESDGR